jgi:hypothetical protein
MIFKNISEVACGRDPNGMYLKMNLKSATYSMS